MIGLIEKEFKINPRFFSFRKEKIGSSLLSLFLILIMVGISTTMFMLLYEKFNTYNAALPFATIYMFALSLISIVIAVFKTRKTFFDKLDFEVTTHRPIGTFNIVISKAVYLFFVLLFLELVLFVPHYFAFGFKTGHAPSYYYMVFLSTVFHTIFDLGLALLLVGGVETIYRFLKKHSTVQIIVIVTVVLGLTFLYSSILNIFLNLLNNNSMTYLFNDQNIAFLQRISLNLYPDVYISRSLLTLNYRQIFSYILIALGVFLMSVVVLSLIYTRVVAINQDKNQIYKERRKNLKGPKFAFLKKEITLLSRDSDNLYNFTALMLISPLLTYLVLRGINESFRNGIFSVYSSILPNFMQSVTILIFLLFSSVLALSSSNLMKSEHRTIRVVKYLPYPITKQIYIKMGLLGITTFATNVISLLLLLIFKEISIGSFFFLIIATSLLNISLIVLSFRSEILNFRNASNDNSLASFLAFVVPVLLAGGNVLLSLTTKINAPIYLYLINIVVLAALFVFVIFYLRFQFKRDLSDLEVVN